ncbi:MAG: type II toxin-antitoxin system Phd/YefM family antitoxin [Candidatus Poribacteria bacterium]|nr:type II toxin-antitoxin system Phd/YefM family antitoxin [Candidatus Poribacteria bacterium]
MKTINIHEAKTRFSQLVERAQAGEEVIIAKAGVPVAKLIRYNESDVPRQPGFWRGKVRIADDFDELPEAFTAFFEESDQ